MKYFNKRKRERFFAAKVKSIMYLNIIEDTPTMFFLVDENKVSRLSSDIRVYLVIPPLNQVNMESASDFITTTLKECLH
ncbi:MAG: hypothetical protein ACTSQZ_08875 [Candidatus Thorarchaeota archaeon]